NNINAQQTPNGVFVEIKDAGAEPKATAGKIVSVNYTGTLISTGKKFDSNVDPSFNHVEPFTFPVGRGQVIPGWDEGLTMFGKGGKGTLFIPAMLAYGPRGSGIIPPFAALK